MVFDLLLRKIVVYLTQKRQFYIVRVCAWCPKETYPKLEMWQTYSHGICRKHYLLLQRTTLKKIQKTKNTGEAQIVFQKIWGVLFPKDKIIPSL
jgi:hypothetical protein